MKACIWSRSIDLSTWPVDGLRRQAQQGPVVAEDRPAAVEAREDRVLRHVAQVASGSHGPGRVSAHGNPTFGR